MIESSHQIIADTATRLRAVERMLRDVPELNKFEAVALKGTSVFDEPAGEMAAVYEAHAKMKRLLRTHRS